ncbi:MAG TPA: TetR/AcrR family transcriptional regulator [Vicinamibacterales bacterium]|nr:TetR/AcrR family transcriptional regulator [Vicinamibacterales bacterium]
MHADATGQTSHERMLRAALELFARHGFTHTSTAQIAHAAGTSESQLIKHFGTKEGLLEAIFEGAWRGLNVEVGTLLDASESPAAAVRTVMRFVLGRLDKEPELKRLMLFEGRRVRAHGLAVTAGFQQFVDRLDALLRRAKRAGEFRERVPVAAVRSALIGAFEGLLRDRVLAVDGGYRGGYTARDIERAMDAVIDTFLKTRARRARAR